MSITGQTPWRQLGDLAMDQFTALIPDGSPMLPESRAIYAAVQGYSALYAAQALHESEWGTTGIAKAHPDWHNGLGNTVPGSDHEYMQFPSWTAGAAWWKQHVLTYPAYTNTDTIADYISVYAPKKDGNNEERYVQVICEIANKVTPASPAGGTAVGKLSFGRVPFPGYVDRQDVTADKPEGIGWNNLGQRVPRFIVLHRMLGTLTGTDQYFRTAQALTDYGIGTANIDGAALDGYIYQWNNPRGYRAGWASGPVSAPYGDGLRWLTWGYQHGYDANIVNICGVSMEDSGFYDDAISDFAFGELAKWVAYWFDQFGIAHDKAPIHPETGFSAITWHQEWTIGTGKICPGPWLMDRTQKLIDAASAIMKVYQEGGSMDAGKTTEPPKQEKPPTPKWARPVPIKELIPYGKESQDKAKAVVIREGVDFIFVGDTVKAIRDTPRLQYASAKSARTGPDIKAGETFDVLWMFRASDGELYYLTGYWTRVRVADTERVKD